MGYLPGSKHALLCASIHCKSNVQVYQLKISLVVFARLVFCNQ